MRGLRKAQVLCNLVVHSPCGGFLAWPRRALWLSDKPQWIIKEAFPPYVIISADWSHLLGHVPGYHVPPLLLPSPRFYNLWFIPLLCNVAPWCVARATTCTSLHTIQPDPNLQRVGSKNAIWDNPQCFAEWGWKTSENWQTVYTYTLSYSSTDSKNRRSQLEVSHSLFTRHSLLGVESWNLAECFYLFYGGGPINDFLKLPLWRKFPSV